MQTETLTSTAALEVALEADFALESHREDIARTFKQEVRHRREYNERIADYDVVRGTCEQIQGGGFRWHVELVNSRDEDYELHGNGWFTDVPFHPDMTVDEIADALFMTHDHSRSLIIDVESGGEFEETGYWFGDHEPIWLLKERLAARRTEAA